MLMIIGEEKENLSSATCVMDYKGGKHSNSKYEFGCGWKN